MNNAYSVNTTCTVNLFKILCEKRNKSNLIDLLRGWTWVHSSLTVVQSNVNESSGVQHSLVSTTLWFLWLFLLFNFWSLGLDLTSTS